MARTEEQFDRAAKNWDLETLYDDLASAKGGKRLTPTEKLHLRGLLCGYSPAEIAQKLGKSVKGVEVELCNTLYPYVKNLVGKSNEKMENWRNICEWLEDAGYRTQSSSEERVNSCIPVDIIGKIAKISIKKDKITLEIDLLRVDEKLSSELPIEDLDANELNDI